MFSTQSVENSGMNRKMFTSTIGTSFCKCAGTYANDGWKWMMFGNLPKYLRENLDTQLGEESKYVQICIHDGYQLLPIDKVDDDFIQLSKILNNHLALILYQQKWVDETKVEKAMKDAINGHTSSLIGQIVVKQNKFFERLLSEQYIPGIGQFLSGFQRSPMNPSKLVNFPRVSSNSFNIDKYNNKHFSTNRNIFYNVFRTFDNRDNAISPDAPKLNREVAQIFMSLIKSTPTTDNKYAYTKYGVPLITCIFLKEGDFQHSILAEDKMCTAYDMTDRFNNTIELFGLSLDCLIDVRKDMRDIMGDKSDVLEKLQDLKKTKESTSTQLPQQMSFNKKSWASLVEDEVENEAETAVEADAKDTIENTT